MKASNMNGMKYEYKIKNLETTVKHFEEKAIPLLVENS